MVITYIIKTCHCYRTQPGLPLAGLRYLPYDCNDLLPPASPSCSSIFPISAFVKSVLKLAILPMLREDKSHDCADLDHSHNNLSRYTRVLRRQGQERTDD